MQAVFAGVMGWTIEVGIVLLALYLLKREETKVIERRKKEMASFCYDCTADLFGEEHADKNEFAGIVRKHERYFCLCEGCGWVTLDGDGKKVEEDD